MIKKYIREVLNFPRKGINYRDITPLLGNSEALRGAVDILGELFDPKDYDSIAGMEARGFILGGALAYELGKPFIPIRKAGKLPYNTIRESYGLEYGKDSVEIHTDAVRPGDRVLLIDDLLATGGTLRAGATLIERLGGRVAGMGVLIELSELKGREKLNGYEVKSVLKY